MIHRLMNIGYDRSCSTRTDTGWMMAVPLPFYGGLFDRMRDAWAVLTGRAYAFHWPQPGEYERAVREP